METVLGNILHVVVPFVFTVDCVSFESGEGICPCPMSQISHARVVSDLRRARAYAASLISVLAQPLSKRLGEDKEWKPFGKVSRVVVLHASIRGSMGSHLRSQAASYV